MPLVVLVTTVLVPLPRDDPPAQAGIAASHGHLRQPRFLAIMVAGSLIQASHAVYYGFSTLDWTRPASTARPSARCGRSA